MVRRGLRAGSQPVHHGELKPTGPDSQRGTDVSSWAEFMQVMEEKRRRPETGLDYVTDVTLQ